MLKFKTTLVDNQHSVIILDTTTGKEHLYAQYGSSSHVVAAIRDTASRDYAKGCEYDLTALPIVKMRKSRKGNLMRTLKDVSQEKQCI